MKIFVSWSGKHSLAVATALKEWFPLLFNGIELFVSSEDIRKGKRWPAEVSKELGASNFGIVCLTPDNLDAPWLLFEAGALSKSITEASVYTLLTGGLRIGDIEGPLSHFQHTVFEREDFFKLVKSINEIHGQGKKDEAILRRIFDKFWDELEVAVAKVVKTDSKPEKKRSSEELLHEILELASHIARNMPESRERQIPVELRTEHRVGQKAFWKDFVERIGRASPFVRAYFLETDGKLADDGTLTVYFPPGCEDNIMLVDNEKNSTLAKKILTDMGLNASKIVFTPWASRPNQPPPRRPAR